MINMETPLPQLMQAYKQRATRDLTGKTEDLKNTIIQRVQFNPNYLSSQEGQQMAPEIGRLLKEKPSDTPQSKRLAAQGV